MAKKRGISKTSSVEKVVMSKMDIREKMAIGGIESHLLREKRAYIYTALEDIPVNFHWGLGEVKLLEKLWEEGKSLLFIAKELKRSPVDVVLLIIDRDFKGKIKPRRRGIWGTT
jgi:hypothetical protein